MKGTLRGGARRAVVVAAVAVVGVLAPVDAEAGEVTGGGALAGTLSYHPGVSPSPEDCRITVTDLALTSVTTVRVPGLYVGPLSFTGTATATPVFCETVYRVGATVDLEASGTNATGDELTCSLHGGLIRAFSMIGMDVSGSCELNGVPTPTVYLSMGLEWAPALVDTAGDIVTAGVAGAFIAGY